ncbi:MAG TPA: exonuclease domain-containing protein [Conexibacter sp.]|nr:exonuclease domain-containing protein [Conexibacter sp.]
MSWHQRRLAAFDLETTGIDSESDRIVTAAVSVVGDGLPPVFHAWLLDPGIEIPAGASAVHGITTERARAEGRPPLEAVEQIVATLAEQLLQGVPVIAFNARFDLTCLDREARRHGIAPLIDRVGPDGMLVVDPYVLDKQVDRFRKGKRTLGAVCAHYNVPLDEAHASHADALAAARVAWRLGQAFEELSTLDLPTLHGQQIRWAAEQAASFEDYLRRNGRDERIESAWPIVPLRAPAPQPETAPPLAA